MAQHQSCTVMRRKMVRHGTLNMATGATADGHSEWVTEPCGIPLFAPKHRETGICRSCESGWTHPENYAVETAETTL